MLKNEASVTELCFTDTEHVQVYVTCVGIIEKKLNKAYITQCEWWYTQSSKKF